MRWIPLLTPFIGGKIESKRYNCTKSHGEQMSELRVHLSLSDAEADYS